MVESIGKRLCQARLAKGLSIDEAAHATKMRPDKILALENDDYSRFGNNAYAKGFLQIYGRFLGVEVAGQMRDLETPTHVSVDDYQYLNNAPEPPKVKIRTERREKPGPPSIVPLLVVVTLFFMGIFGFWMVVSAQRLGLDKTPGSGHPVEKAAPSSPEENRVSAPVAPATSPVAPPGVRTEALASTSSQPSRPVQPTAGTTSVNLRPVAQPPSNTVDNTEVRRAELATPPNSSAKSPIEEPANGVNEVVVEPIKKTWVTIRRGRPDSPPVFEDYLYPGAPPLKLHGTKFFVEVRDQTAVQIRKNGSPIAYQAPGISIQ